jgi:hypothetical protein
MSHHVRHSHHSPVNVIVHLHSFLLVSSLVDHVVVRVCAASAEILAPLQENESRCGGQDTDARGRDEAFLHTEVLNPGSNAATV